MCVFQERFEEVFRAMGGIKTQERVLECLDVLDSEEHDYLMSMVYTGLAKGDAKTSAFLFMWHSALVEHAGLGCVVRVLTDKNDPPIEEPSGREPAQSPGRTVSACFPNNSKLNILRS